MTDYLVVRAYRTRLGIILLEGKCPFCHKKHTHGGGYENSTDLLGSRLSHCINNPKNYELVFEVPE